MRLRVLLTLATVGVVTLACAGAGGKDGEDDPGIFEDQDADGDGYTYAEDCNDDNKDINPGEDEECDPANIDENCNGVADSDDPDVEDGLDAYHDADLDGYGDGDNPATVCELSAGFVTDNDDCDDTDPTVNPGALEICDEDDVDEDCNGDEDDDDDDVSTDTFGNFYADADLDGYGDPSVGEARCDAPDGYADNDEDCDDTNSTAYPEAQDTWYDGVDSDCSGGSDYDQDLDGHDAEAYGGDDCDDRASRVYPGADEDLYDGVDADCSGGSDYDGDGDGQDADAWGGTDCDDEDATTYLGAYETGSRDSNCDGVTAATPEAVADYDATTSTLLTCATLFLDGSGSRDPSGSPLAYAWELVSAPATSVENTDDIVNVDDESPTFVPTAGGDYIFELVVENPSGVESFPDMLTVTVDERTTNTGPVADAGLNQSDEQDVACETSGYVETCEDCADVTFDLDASASTDADDDALTYSWRVSSGIAALSATTGVTTSVTVPGGTTTDGGTDTTSVVITLTVTDCFGETSTDSVSLSLECTGT